jgi:hypothetical protein
MRRPNETPSIFPNEDDQTVCLVPIGRIWRETEYEDTDLETVILDLLFGQYKTRAVSGVF